MIFRFDGFELDTEGFRLSRDGETVRIQPQSLELLVFLIERRERLVSKEELFEQLWPDRCVGDAALASCLRGVRLALGDDARRPRYVETHHGKGLRFCASGVIERAAPVRRAESASSPGTPEIQAVEPPQSAASPPAHPPAARLRPVLFIATLLALTTVVAVVWQRSAGPRGNEGEPALAPTGDGPVLVLLELSTPRADRELEVLGAALTDAAARVLPRLGWTVFGPDSTRDLVAARSLAEIAETLPQPLIVTGSLVRDGSHQLASLELELHDFRDQTGSRSFEPLRISIPTLEGASGLDGVRIATGRLAGWLGEALVRSIASNETQHTLDVPLPSNLSAYRLYLRGSQWLKEPGCEAGARAELIEQSLGLEPGFAPTWMLAALLHQRLGTSCLFGRQHLEEALAAAERAASLDPHALDPGLMAASLHFELGRTSPALEISTSVRLQFPHHPAPACLEAHLATAVGAPRQADAALELCQRSRGLLGATGLELPTTSLLLGEIDHFLATTELDSSVRGRYFRGLALHLVNRDAEARAILDPLFAASPSEIWGRLAHALLAAIEGRPEETVRIVTTLRDVRAATGLRDGAFDYSLAQLLALAGEPDNALALLHQAAERGFHCVPCLKADPALIFLRERPAFPTLIEHTSELTAELRR